MASTVINLNYTRDTEADGPLRASLDVQNADGSTASVDLSGLSAEVHFEVLELLQELTTFNGAKLIGTGVVQ